MDTYKHLMEKQIVSAETTAKFYEALEKPDKKRKSFRWKAALIAACVALMIPLTVFAASNIISQPKVKIGATEHFPNRIGYILRFDNMQSFPLSTFSKNVQGITEYKQSYLNSWAAAEKTLGIDLMHNTILEDDNTAKGRIVNPDGHSAHCVISYCTSDEQLYYVQVDATYIVKSKHTFSVKAKIAVEHPNLTADETQILHGITIGYPDNTTISYEEHTTKEGIPVAMLTTQGDSNYIHGIASFAVNNIAYEIHFTSTLNEQAVEQALLLEILDAFVLE